MTCTNNRKGFTLVEMVLSIALLTLIVGMTLPAFRTFSIRNDLDIAVNQIVQNLYRAQTLSQIGDGDINWGVHMATGSILVYKGASFASRDMTYDEITDISPSIAITGVVDVTFSKFTGLPQTTGTTTLTSTANEIRNVTINAKGMVNY